MTAQFAAWKRNGPPPNISLIAVARGLGIDLLKAGDSVAPGGQMVEVDLPPDAVPISAMTESITMPIAGGDTAAASLALLARLRQQKV